MFYILISDVRYFTLFSDHFIVSILKLYNLVRSFISYAYVSQIVNRKPFFYYQHFSFRILYIFMYYSLYYIYVYRQNYLYIFWNKNVKRSQILFFNIFNFWISFLFYIIVGILDDVIYWAVYYATKRPIACTIKIFNLFFDTNAWWMGLWEKRERHVDVILSTIKAILL